ncbi:MAG: long-chain-fatty-acid--CoA ligase [Dehalococcoidales bacterium]|nr:long-chain-fatty-acid--CoA ligase [Dehalococcoidales bacterium]
MSARTFPEYSTRYPLLLTTIMKRPVGLYPDDIGIVYRNDDGEYFRFTWKEWYQRTCQLANVLRVLDVKPAKPPQHGDRVATMALNHHRHLELVYAVSCFGAVAHPINVRLSPEHIIYTINHAGDKVIFFDDVFLPMLETIYDRIKSTVQKFVYISDKPGKPKTRIAPLYLYEELLKEQPANFEWPFLDEDTYATLYYTTGTTGLPKGVMFTHRQLYLQCVHLVLDHFASPKPVGTLPEPVINMLLNVPMFHIHAWGSPYYEVFNANKLVFPGKFTPRSFCELTEKEQITSTGLVPTMLAMLIEYKDIKKYDLSSLRRVSIGGAALPLGLKAKAEALIPGFAITSGYGMTETAAGSLAPSIKRNMLNWPKEEIDKVRVKTGLPFPGIEAQVIDKEGKPVPHDNETIGEIILRGHWVMEQYYNDPERTATAWRDGWFHTGDAAKIDKDGYVIIADRITDVIRSGAEMVPTVLLENLTCSADFVLEATFVGVPDEMWGERPMAIIKPAPGTNPTAKDFMTFLEEEGVATGKITKWMLPDYVVFTNDIPKTSVGKYDKITIRKRLEEFKSKATKVQ